jgi:hypothetical protein
VRLDAAKTNIGFAACALGMRKAKLQIKKIQSLFAISEVYKAIL